MDGDALRGQGELRGISISPLTPTPLKTSRDTLHPETGVTSLTIALRGTSEGWDYEFADHKNVGARMARPKSGKSRNLRLLVGFGAKPQKRRKA